ncbi:hypothetical protein Tco_1252263 [Tanacetum coccineum]
MVIHLVRQKKGGRPRIVRKPSNQRLSAGLLPLPEIEWESDLFAVILLVFLGCLQRSETSLQAIKIALVRATPAGSTQTEGGIDLYTCPPPTELLVRY